ncbi:MAG TPA: efflux RND transporter periplasmic adaptor subunit [Terriglobales bacterium]|nr:efflux RND transporter periplasmic adaptor subunit [Terriglobales bacterium]
MRFIKSKWFILGLLVVGVVLFAAFGMNRKEKTEYFTATVDKGDIRQVVEATGTINAVTTVQVGSQVSGTIWKLFADFNSHVKKGQLIAQIEPSIFQGQVLQARADLENAKANLAAAKANLEKAKATAVQTRADYERTQGLVKEGVLSKQQYDLAKANAESSDAAVSAGQAQVTQAAAQVQQRQAALSVSETNLQHTYIYAPIDGTVTNRAVDIGQTVAASFQAPVLFTIAQDLTKMQVYAKTDESDIGQIRRGQKVSFRVDAFPRDTFSGMVTQVRMNPTTVQNVVTYDTVIDFDNPELKLFPGMTAYISIPVATANDVLRVTNGALRYKPDLPQTEIRALYQKNGIQLGGRGRQNANGGQETAHAGQQAPSDNGQQSGQRRRMAQGGEQPGGGSAPSAGGNANPAGKGAGSGASDAASSGLDRAVVWKLTADKQLVPVQIKTGITDHTVTEVVQVLAGQLKEGDTLITGSSKAATARAPGMGGPPRR